MGKQRKYFVLNRETDFQKSDESSGVYYTGILDSGEPHMKWHRLVFDGEPGGKAEWTVTVYAADSLILAQGEEADRVIADERLTQAQRDAKLQKCVQAVLDGERDALLFGVTGRYLWLKIEFRDTEWEKSGIGGLRIYFPKHTWLCYLPEIYGQDAKSASFLERYLGIFQSLYEDMTEWIEGMPGLLEPSDKEEHMLYELADWLGIEETGLWDKEQLLYLVKNAGRMNRQRGTVENLKELVWLYTGRRPYIVEYHQIRRYFDGGRRERLLKTLYASHCNEFAVILDEEDCGQGERLYGLMQVIDKAKPAQMESRITVLRPYIFLDQHSYLGINSVLGQYRAFRLDGQCKVPFSVISAEKEKGRQTT